MRGEKPRILAFAGSLRSGSYNKKLLQVAVEAAEKRGALITSIDLADYPMAIYDGDIEEAKGLPEAAKQLKKLFLEHEGLLIASPEYNSSISAALKNAIDWISRPEGNEEVLLPFRNKVAALMSLSPGYFGGMRGLVHLRSILSNIGVMVLPRQLILPNGYQAFDEKGQLIERNQQKGVEELTEALQRTLLQLHREEKLVER